MNRFISNKKAVSPVIATLMLVVIAVAAAGSFAVFTNQRQEMIQEEQIAELERKLEKIEIINIGPNYNHFNNTLENISITIANRHTKDSRIRGIRLNNHLWLSSTITFPLMFDSYNDSSFYIQNLSELFQYKNITVNEPITIEILTDIGNSFIQTFYPPSAIIYIDTKTEMQGGNPVDFKLLDGSLSDHPGENAYITNWNWYIYNNTNREFYNLSGRVVRAGQNITNGDEWEIALTAIDNFGMKGLFITKYQN
jgi:flagellin-like protein